MCGIAALFGDFEPSEILEMTEAVAHRGPDGEGVKEFGWGALGHRRLSILDLSSSGAQPFSDPTGRYCITYNGEIYNYLELKDELEKLGYQFHSKCDTEVLLNGWIEWGESLLPRLNGMFAFVAVDLKEKRYFAARDRFGIKPLYYWKKGKKNAFASEIKQFIKLKGWRPIVNDERAYDYLVHGVTDHTEETLFLGVQQLRGGHCISDGQIKCWYDPVINPFTGSFEEAAETFYQLLSDSVDLRLHADVEVGSCLSGGLDSSSIVCLMNKQLQEKSSQKTFSALSDVKAFDESDYMRAVVDKLQVNHFTVTPSPDELFQVLSEMVYFQDEPFASTSPFAQWKVFELVKERGIKVMLDGQGADEQMGGYHTFFGNHYFELLRCGKIGQLLAEVRAAKKIHRGHSAWRRLAALMVPIKLQQPLRKMQGKKTLNPQWLGPKLNNISREPFKNPQRFNEHLKLQTMQSNLPMLLHLEDRNSMAHSVEARTPFLDYRLVEFSLSLPHHYQLQGGITKQVLRKGMCGTLPEKVRSRVDKLGFSTPESHWAKTHFQKPLGSALKECDGYVSENVREATYSALWRACCFGAWRRRFF